MLLQLRIIVLIISLLVNGDVIMKIVLSSLLFCDSFSEIFISAQRHTAKEAIKRERLFQQRVLETWVRVDGKTKSGGKRERLTTVESPHHKTGREGETDAEVRAKWKVEGWLFGCTSSGAKTQERVEMI